MPSKYPPSQQVKSGSFGPLITLHALTGAGWRRLAQRPGRPHPVPSPGELLAELRAGSHTFAYAQGERGIIAPAEGALVAAIGCPWGGRDDEGGRSWVALIDPERLTAQVEDEVGRLLDGAVSAVGVVTDEVTWMLADGSLTARRPLASGTGDRVVAAVAVHDAATSKAVHPVRLTPSLLDAVASEAGLVPAAAGDGERTVVYRGVAMCVPAGYEHLDVPEDMVVTTAGETLKSTFEMQTHHVLAGPATDAQASTYATLRVAGQDLDQARSAARSLTE